MYKLSFRKLLSVFKRDDLLEPQTNAIHKQNTSGDKNLSNIKKGVTGSI